MLGKYLGPISLANEKLPNVVYAVIILSVVIVSVVNSKISFQQIIKYVGIWVLIIGGLLVVYTYKNNMKKIFNDVYVNVVPGVVVEEVKEGENTVTVVANQTGHFFVNSVVNGVDMRFLIDTGATDVALTRYDAKRLGVDLSKLSYTKRVATANGIAWYAPIKLNYIKIGNIVVYDVTAAISSNDRLSKGLLGMGFLNRLKSYRVHNDSLTIVEK